MSRKELMSAELRHQLSDRVEILEKVKAVFLISQLVMATTEQVAEYFGVPAKTISMTYLRNKEELDANGTVLLTPSMVNALNLQNVSSVAVRGGCLFSIDNDVFAINYRGTHFYPPRAILCMAMLLRNSAVAAEIRTQLLNLVEAAPAQMKIANIQAQEEVALKIAKAMMSGDMQAMSQAYTEMMALQNHTIATQSSLIDDLTTEKEQLVSEKLILAERNSQLCTREANLVERTTALAEENDTLAKRNCSLELSNKMMAEEALLWDPQRVCNAIIRRVAQVAYYGKYGAAWYDFYHDLQYQEGIYVGKRGGGSKNASALSTIKDEEWPRVMRVLASTAYRYCIDVVDVTNEVVVEAYELDRVQTEDGVRFNRAIAQKRYQMPPAPSRPRSSQVNPL